MTTMLRQVRTSDSKAESANGAIAAPGHYPAAPRISSDIDHFSNTMKLMVVASKATGFTISAGLRVGERHTAQLLGYSGGVLKAVR